LNPFEIKKKDPPQGFKKEGDFGEAKKVIIFGENKNYILTQKRPFNVKPSFQRVCISTGKIFVFLVIILDGIKKTSPQDKIQKSIFFLNYQIFLYRTPFLKEVWFKMLQNDER